jgi:hypothetical protein
MRRNAVTHVRIAAALRSSSVVVAAATVLDSERGSCTQPRAEAKSGDLALTW